MTDRDITDLGDEQARKMGTAAIVLGAALIFVCGAAAIVLWTLPTATNDAISGSEIGLPFTGVGAVFLALSGVLIARMGWRARQSAGPRRPEPPLRKPARPMHGEWTTE